MDDEKTELELAEEIWGKDSIDLEPDDAEFLEDAIALLKRHRKLPPKDSARILLLSKKYIHGDRAAGVENPDEADLDEDDFV